jgi:hypothetical protein
MRTYRDRQAKPVGRGCLVLSEIQADTAASCEILKFSTKVLKNRRNVQKSVGIGCLNLESVSAESEAQILKKLKGRGRDFGHSGKQDSKTYQLLQNGQTHENSQHQSTEHPSQEHQSEHQNTLSQNSPLLLYTAFICPQARNLPNIPISDQNIRTFTAPSTFLVVRSAIFSGTDKTFITETVHTQISPKYNCKLMWPMRIEPALVGLFRNNLVIVEVWNKAVTGNKLLGLVKVSTHQWFLSLEDESVAKHAVSCTYPLVAADGWLPIVNVFTGETVGELRLKVALGSDTQLENFNNKTENSNNPEPNKITTHKIPKTISRPLNSPEKTFNENPENIIKILQTFTISIKCLIGLIYNDELTSLICDGTELFVQYHFLDQDSENKIHAKKYKSKNVVFFRRSR